MTSRLHQIALGVSDLDVARNFYSGVLGLREIKTFDPPGLAFFALSDTRLLLERTANPSPGGGVLYLYVDGILDRHAALAADGVEFSAPPQLIHVDSEGDFGEVGVEEWMAFFVDPDGNQLALVERRPPSSE